MRKSFRALCITVAFAALLLVLSIAPAFAISTHALATSFGSAGSEAGQVSLASNSGVAVNATTHDVYVADTGNARVDQFSATGTFIRAWGWGVADGLPAFETCTLACQAGIQGSGAGQFTSPAFVAVDNSGGASAGDVYVGDSANKTVAKFSATGAYVSTNDGASATAPVAGPFGELAGITIDGSGDLWAYDTTGDMFEFTQSGAFVTDWNSGRGVIPNGIDADPAGNLYVLTGGGSVEQFSSSGVDVGPVNGDASDPTGFALDRSSGDVYMDSGGSLIRHYEAACDAGGNCAAVDTFGTGQLGGAAGLATDPSNHEVFAADTADNRIDAFTSAVLPDVTTGEASSITTTTVTLEGSVNPDSTTLTDCHFSYVDEAHYNTSAADPYAAGQSAPCTATPSGSNPEPVTANVTGLTPGDVYHYRLSAANASGALTGADEAFATPGPPLIGTTSAANVISTAADLRAQVNPDRLSTTYHFEYGTSPSYGQATPESAPIGSDDTEHTATAHIQGLAPNTTYHFRVVATSSAAPGGAPGPDHTFTTQPNSGEGGADTCPNAAIRGQQHAAALPDCRAYEQASPPEKDGSPVLAQSDLGHFWQASANGNSVVYSSMGAFAGAQTGESVIFQYLASRTQSGWSTNSLLPPQATSTPTFPEPTFDLYSEDLSKGVLIDGGSSSGAGQDQPALVPGEPANNENLFLRDNSTNSYQLIDVTPQGVTPAEAELPLASADLSHVVFRENAQLTPDSPPAGENQHLFEWSGGTVHLVGILPDGTPVPASQRTTSQAVSEDGSRVFFVVGGRFGGSEKLYVRQDGASTVQLDASHGSGPGGGGEFAVASSDGSRSFFLDDATSGITSDTVPGSGANLYRYEANSGTLTDLTPTVKAEVQGVIGTSKDGSYVYFVANGVLAPGASPGDCPRLRVETEPTQTCSLYLFHDGTTSFIAALNGEDFSDWHTTFSYETKTAVVSPDGRYLAFQSLNSLTGYDNLAANSVQCETEQRPGIFNGEFNGAQPRCSEVFLYDALNGPSGKIVCASCNPSGGAPIGPAMLRSGTLDYVYNYMPRYLGDSGRLFFNSGDALTPQDVNGKQDAYEFEPAGVGSCGQAQGCVSLISSGRSPNASIFFDASASGDDAFFATTDPLVAQDGDQSRDLYDARVEGGIAAQNVVPVPPCGGESCKAPASTQPVEQAPSSNGFSGAGNLAPSVPAASHKKPVKKTKKKHPAVKKKRRQKKPRHARGRRANHNHRGAK
ncbi:MAG TPA: hypothetical protein VIC06_11340 [Solirubrobacteraceae bacterium]|jgi:sugar lactone lactonase YvrE